MCTILAYRSVQVEEETIVEMLNKTISRGPDAVSIKKTGKGYLGFQRLAIMDLSDEGMQPFQYKGNMCVCNGEIYGFRKIKQELINNGIKFKSESDCEVLLPLYELYGTDMFAMLDGEFAFIIYDWVINDYIVARDPIGIRPLFYGYDKDHKIVFASEAKNLVGVCKKIIPFPIGHYYYQGKFISYCDIAEANSYIRSDIDEICKNIHDKLIDGIKKRLDADAPIGFLLSGGLDSSLVCAISQKIINKPIETFAIGMDVDAIDLKYAREVAEYIGSHHHEIIISKNDVIDAIETVISAIGSFDITTVRASIGMYLLCKAIHQTTNIKVILTGEISDELFGYKYTDFAPNAAEFQLEAQKRIRELYMYDVLRADRCISSNSLEARVPFGDLDFVKYVMHIDPEIKMNRYGKGKYLLRHAFEKDDILPVNILMREKAAFSDAVGHSLVDDIKEYAESLYSDEEFEASSGKYRYLPPISKEALLYRNLFEKYYPGNAGMIKDFWMPNKKWPNCEINDPSARYLPNYGNSGM